MYMYVHVVGLPTLHVGTSYYRYLESRYVLPTRRYMYYYVDLPTVPVLL